MIEPFEFAENCIFHVCPIMVKHIELEMKIGRQKLIEVLNLLV